MLSGLWGPALALIGLSYAPENNKEYAVIMLTVAVGINAGQFAGYMVSIKIYLYSFYLAHIRIWFIK